MSFEVWIARTFIFLPALLVLFIDGAAVAIVWHYIRLWREKGFNDVSSNVWVALTVATVLNLMLLALMDVGQALMLFGEYWGGVVGVCSTLLMPLLTYKGLTKIAMPKGGSIESEVK